MLKKSVCVLLALCLLFLTACASSGSAGTSVDENFIECPLPGIEWGMTKAEVLEKFTFPEDYPYPGDIESLKEAFAGEDTGTWVKPSFIGWEDPSVAGMELSYYAFDSTNLHAISLCFSEPIDGEQYLVEIIVNLRAEDEEAYHTALTAAYGEPAYPSEDANTPFWISTTYGTEVDAATVAAYEEAGLRLTKYFDPSLQTWHTLPVVYPFFGTDEVVDGMLNFPTIFDARQYVMVKLFEENQA